MLNAKSVASEVHLSTSSLDKLKQGENVSLRVCKLVGKNLLQIPVLREFARFARMQTHSLHAVCKPIAKAVVAN